MRLILIGNFGDSINGQSIRSNNIKKILDREPYHLYLHDTNKKLKSILGIPKLIWYIYRSDVVIPMLGSQALVRLFPTISYASSCFKKPIIFISIGGWLDTFLAKRPYLHNLFKRNFAVLTQTPRLRESLESILPSLHIKTLPNFRLYEEHVKDAMKDISNIQSRDDELNVVYHARIAREKGIFLLLKLASNLQKNAINGVSFSIYGPIADRDRAEFFKLLESTSNTRYLGIIPPTKIRQSLSTYDLSVLPTFYNGEGFPGTILDAYSAGIPVLTTKWLDIPYYVESGVTGYLCEPNNYEDFESAFLKIYNNRKHLVLMKGQIIKYAERFSPHVSKDILDSMINLAALRELSK